IILTQPSCIQSAPRYTTQMEAQQAAINTRARRGGADRCDVCRWKPRLFWSEKKVSMRKRFEYKRHVSSAEAILLTKYRGSFHPLAQPQMSIIGPYAARVNHTSDNATRVPGLRHAPKVSRRKV